MRQRRDLFGQHLPVADDIAGAYLQQVIEPARDHVALLDLGHLQDGAVEGAQRRLAGIRQFHLDKGHMRQPHAHRIKQRAIAGDHTLFLKPAQPGLRGRFRQPDAVGKLGHADTPVGGHDADDGLIEAVERQLVLIQEEVDMRGNLFERGHGSKVSYLEVKRAMAAMQSELSRLVGQEQAAMEAVEEIEDRVEDLEKTERKNALAELGVVTAEIVQVQELINQLQDRFERLQIVSPVKGFVKDIKVKSKGSIVPAGGVVMDVVPIDDELRVETRISTKDVGHVNQGQEVTVKVASFDFARYGSVEGVLENISATTYIDETNGAPYYKGIVNLEHPYVGDDPNHNKILPGMTVQADIMTGEKTLFQYLLKPIYVSLQQSFRER